MSNVTGPGTAQDRNRLFEQLVDRYQEPVLRMCYYCLCDKTQAEDAGKKLSNLQSFPVDGIGRVDSCLLAQEG